MKDVFHCIRIKNTYLTAKPTHSKPMFITFQTVKSAHTCKKFIEFHTQKYGTWPSFNMELTKEEMIYEMSTLGFKEPMYIERKEFSEIEDIMKKSNAGILHCHEFCILPYENTYTINFRAEEMEVEPTLDTYLESLENTLSAE